MNVIAASDFRRTAKRRIPNFLFEYLDGGSFAELTKRRNRSALDQILIRQRVLRDVSCVDTSTELLNQRLGMPVILGPVGLAGMYARRGECQAVRAAESCEIPFTLSTVGICSIQEVETAAEKPFWFQLYMIRDRQFMIDLLDRAKEAGCSVLVFTVDMPLPGKRYRDYRSGLAGATRWRGHYQRFLQSVIRPAWAWDVAVRGRPHHLGNVTPVLKGKSGLEDFTRWMNDNFDPEVTWQDLEFVRDHWDGPIIVKGILDVEDAKIAGQVGADGIVVSNHGGRQLDSVRSTAEVLPHIADALGDRMKILVDGGIRSGIDVLKFIALGASAVLIGRLWVYALATGGRSSVEKLLRLIESEMRTAMALSGNISISGIDSSSIDHLSRTLQSSTG